MPNIFQIVRDLADFVIKAVETYSQSQEGQAELAKIIADIEGLPLDVQGNPPQSATNQAEFVSAVEADFARLHPNG